MIEKVAVIVLALLAIASSLLIHPDSVVVLLYKMRVSWPLACLIVLPISAFSIFCVYYGWGSLFSFGWQKLSKHFDFREHKRRTLPALSALTVLALFLVLWYKTPFVWWQALSLSLSLILSCGFLFYLSRKLNNLLSRKFPDSLKIKEKMITNWLIKQRVVVIFILACLPLLPLLPFLTILAVRLLKIKNGFLLMLIAGFIRGTSFVYTAYLGLNIIWPL